MENKTNNKIGRPKNAKQKDSYHFMIYKKDSKKLNFFKTYDEMVIFFKTIKKTHIQEYVRSMANKRKISKKTLIRFGNWKIKRIDIKFKLIK